MKALSDAVARCKRLQRNEPARPPAAHGLACPNRHVERTGPQGEGPGITASGFWGLESRVGPAAQDVELMDLS